MFKSVAIRSILVGAMIVASLVGQETAKSRRRARGLKPLATLPKQMPAPKDNPTSEEKVELGKRLFFDARLSGNNRMSCATCHRPEKVFGDGEVTSKGADGKRLTRNTPSLLNVTLFKNLHWDGRAKSLEEQALLPIQNPQEMDQDLTELVKELKAVTEYVDEFKQVFDNEITQANIAQALAAFQRTLVTKPSPFDRYLAGEDEALSASAKRGMELFLGDAGCARCHQGPLFSDNKFYSLGVSLKDDGRMVVTKKKSDRGRMRTPSLRNVAQTGPYMHNGSMKTLDDVVTFYYRGIPTRSPDGRPIDLEPLSGQSFSEIPDIVAFLESLTGEVPKVEAPRVPRLGSK